MRRFGAALLAGLIPALLLAGKAVPAVAITPPESPFYDVRLTRILGATVEDPDAEGLGTVTDLVVNVPAARIEYVLVKSSGFLGLSAHQKALPASAVSAGTIIRHTLSASVKRTEWQEAPVFTSEAAALANRLHSEQARPPAGKSPLSGDAAHNRQDFDPPTVLPATARQHEEASPAANGNGHLQFTSKLLGVVVLDCHHQPLGKISDLLVDLNGQKPPMAILRTGKFLHAKRYFAVPLALLNRAPGNKLLLNADRRGLDNAPVLTEQAWQAAASPGTKAFYRAPALTES